jgi:hypothetical protein
LSPTQFAVGKLRTLGLDNNALPASPRASGFVNSECRTWRQNRFAEIPESIGDLQHLEMLDVGITGFGRSRMRSGRCGTCGFSTAAEVL